MTELTIDIVRVTEEGQGVGFSPDGKTVIVGGVMEDDERVRVKVLEEKYKTIIAKKISKSSSVKAEVPTSTGKKTDNPYEIDEGDDEEDEDDYYD